MLFGKKLFQDKIDPRCVYCARGIPLEEDKVLCSKRGIVDPGGACRRFQYDPLKRVPPKPRRLDTSRLRDEDFKL